MVQFALVLHFYQPPTQSLNLTEEILRSCYLPLCNLLLAKENARVSLDFSGSLLLQIQRIPEHELSLKIRQLSETGRVDFLNSPIYHPISPLTPLDVLARQLLENKKVLENFCNVTKFAGIFPPELAIDQKTYDLFRQTEKFVLVDETSGPGLSNNRQLTEIIRSYPTELSASKFTDYVSQSLVPSPSSPLVCATDAEIFGHHYSERINFLKDLFDQKQFEFVKLSEIAASPQSLEPRTSIKASSWQTSAEDLKNNNPYSYWKSATNSLQQRYYELANLAYQAISKVDGELKASHVLHSAQTHYDQGISSCHPYWLSNLPWWHPDMVEKGAQQLIKAIRTVPIANQEKHQAETFYHQFLMDLWHHQWSGEVEKKYREFDQNRQKSLENLPQL